MSYFKGKILINLRDMMKLSLDKKAKKESSNNSDLKYQPKSKSMDQLSIQYLENHKK